MTMNSRREGDAPNDSPDVDDGRPLTNRQIRLSARVPLIKVAAAAGVAELTTRLYEENPESVKSPSKRAALDAVYAEMRSRACRCCARRQA